MVYWSVLIAQHHIWPIQTGMMLLENPIMPLQTATGSSRLVHFEEKLLLRTVSLATSCTRQQNAGGGARTGEEQALHQPTSTMSIEMAKSTL